jgi:hypothetical protein
VLVELALPFREYREQLILVVVVEAAHTLLELAVLAVQAS